MSAMRLQKSLGTSGVPLSTGLYNAALSVFFVSYSVIEPLTNMVLLRTSLPGLGSGGAFPQAETQSHIDQLYNQESEEDHQSRLDREYFEIVSGDIWEERG